MQLICLSLPVTLCLCLPFFLLNPVYILIHSGYFYSTFSSPLLLRGAPNTARILCRSFTPKSHMQLEAKDLPKLPTWRLEWDLNPQPPVERRQIYQWATSPDVEYVCLSVNSSIYKRINQFKLNNNHQLIYTSICPLACVCVYLCVCLCMLVSVCVSQCLSVCVSVWVHSQMVWWMTTTHSLSGHPSGRSMMLPSMT